jgi:polyvinyl alcohol dehydrogenase (cytochrome)
MLWSYQVHAHDSFLLGCADLDRTENCPKTLGPDWDVPASPVLTTAGGKRILVVFTKPGDLLALDPDAKGKLLWRTNVRGTIAGDGPAPAGIRYTGPLWGGAVNNGYAYMGLSGGGLVAMNLADGARRWYAPLSVVADAHGLPPAAPNPRTPGAVSNIAATSLIPGVIFQGGSDGKEYGVSTADGEVLWVFDTMQSFDTVNGVPAKGGNLNGPGAVIVDGIVYIGSGYTVLAGAPGNVLLAFAPE